LVSVLEETELENGMASTQMPDSLEPILTEMVGLAQEFLAEDGEFFPFAAEMRIDGGVEMVFVETGEQSPSGQELRDFFFQTLQPSLDTGTAVAIGVCLDVQARTPDGDETDAIMVEVQEKSGGNALVFVPYQITDEEGGMLEFGEPYGEYGVKLWTPDSN
jgi:hypothetical protein